MKVPKDSVKIHYIQFFYTKTIGSPVIIGDNWQFLMFCLSVMGSQSRGSPIFKLPVTYGLFQLAWRLCSGTQKRDKLEWKLYSSPPLFFPVFMLIHPFKAKRYSFFLIFFAHLLFNDHYPFWR